MESDKELIVGATAVHSGSQRLRCNMTRYVCITLDETRAKQTEISGVLSQKDIPSVLSTFTRLK